MKTLSKIRQSLQEAANTTKLDYLRRQFGQVEDQIKMAKTDSQKDALEDKKRQLRYKIDAERERIHRSKTESVKHPIQEGEYENIKRKIESLKGQKENLRKSYENASDRQTKDQFYGKLLKVQLEIDKNKIALGRMEESKQVEAGNLAPGSDETGPADGKYAPKRDIEDVTEVLSKSDPVEKWISDFVKSDDKRFAGKSKEERIKMALGAYYEAQKESTAVKEAMDPEKIQAGVVQEIEGDAHELEELSIARQELDELADMADDLYYIFENVGELPPWIQDKISSIHTELRSIYGFVRRKMNDQDLEEKKK